MENQHSESPKPPAVPAIAPPTNRTHSRTSPRKAAAARANSRRSTGPKTPDGKAVSSLNALKHGFWSRDLVNPKIDGADLVADFQEFLDALLADLNPVGAMEELLVEEIAACAWRLRRALRSESRHTWWDEESIRRRAHDDYDEYEGLPSALVNAFGNRGASDERHRRERFLHQCGLSRLLLPDADDMNQILRFERTLKRNLYRALDNLRRSQQARLGAPPVRHAPARAREN
jgi:hypothetical protein